MMSGGKRLSALLAGAVLALAVGALAVVADTAIAATGVAPPPWIWTLPPGVPAPLVPADNPMTVEKVELGRRLFYDTALSITGAVSCATCHRQDLAFTDGLPQAQGATGQTHPRGSMSLVNVAYASVLTWGNPLMTGLEAQLLVPMFGDHPVEMGMAGHEDAILARLRRDKAYARQFAAAFPNSGPGPDPVTLHHLAQAIAAFERSIVSFRSPYDRYRYGHDASAISDAAKRGEALFFGERLECHHCHGGLTFADDERNVATPLAEVQFHNTGLYNIGGTGAYPADNTGVHEITDKAEDMGAFKAPTLRNIALTAPYMHDGSIRTLSEVLDHYAAAGRTLKDGPNAGIGADNPYKDPLVQGFTLTEAEKADIIAFLESLTDEALLTDPRFADPATEGRKPSVP
ncbi:MbnH family di-heme enzyme [Nitrospirillum amazonense]|uniref:MbnH family di-heme enzyme n=1 Tax=Nitrospirillum amazonense TaxID=28077 RepID=UPI002DD4266D|nr:MbnH family di-heme enzyme [Nitrospirillum amazonense]MEC4589647.1 MbnH family di-heme enzyme [Nitrospirillum amazonense]